MAQGAAAGAAGCRPAAATSCGSAAGAAGCRAAAAAGTMVRPIAWNTRGSGLCRSTVSCAWLLAVAAATNHHAVAADHCGNQPPCMCFGTGVGPPFEAGWGAAYLARQPIRCALMCFYKLLLSVFIASNQGRLGKAIQVAAQVPCRYLPGKVGGRRVPSCMNAP